MTLPGGLVFNFRPGAQGRNGVPFFEALGMFHDLAPVYWDRDGHTIPEDAVSFGVSLWGGEDGGWGTLAFHGKRTSSRRQPIVDQLIFGETDRGLRWYRPAWFFPVELPDFPWDGSTPRIV